MTRSLEIRIQKYFCYKVNPIPLQSLKWPDQWPTTPNQATRILMNRLETSGQLKT